jgi:hypothetical protein
VIRILQKSTRRRNNLRLETTAAAVYSYGEASRVRRRDRSTTFRYGARSEMGRQIAIIAARPDELAILHKVSELADSDIRVFRRRAAESPEALWIEDWETTPVRDATYGIWPTAFRWKPRYRQIKPPCVPEVEDKWVFANDNVAPVIELSRHVHRSGSAGRLYWGKYFSATEPLAYDVAEFDRLVSALWRWIRKTGHAPGRGAHRTFVMPNARRRSNTRAP